MEIILILTHFRKFYKPLEVGQQSKYLFHVHETRHVLYLLNSCILRKYFVFVVAVVVVVVRGLDTLGRFSPFPPRATTFLIPV